MLSFFTLQTWRYMHFKASRQVLLWFYNCVLLQPIFYNSVLFWKTREGCVLSSSADINILYKYVVHLHIWIQAKFYRGSFFLLWLQTIPKSTLRSSFLFFGIPCRKRLAILHFSLTSYYLFLNYTFNKCHESIHILGYSAHIIVTYM